jgi:predicted dehydrogenase
MDHITAQFHYRHVDSVTITGGWHHRGAYPFSMEYTVIADNGVVEFNSEGRPATVYWKDERSEPLQAPELDPFVEQMRYFVQCCQSGQSPALGAPGESALAVAVAQTMSGARSKNGDKVPCEILAVRERA